MNYNLLLLIIAVETAPVPNNFDWRPIISSIVLCVIAGVINYWFALRKGASKRDTNHFIAFMDESAEFREEMRKDRERLKIELELVHKERDIVKERLQEYEDKYEECSRIVTKHTRELNDAQEKMKAAEEEIVILHTKIKKLKEALYVIKGTDND